MALIPAWGNGETLKITSDVSTPTVVYYTSAAVSRVDNSKCKVTFVIDTELITSNAWFGDGYALDFYFKVGDGAEQAINIKHKDEVWRGKGRHSRKELNYGDFVSTSAGNVTVQIRAVAVNTLGGTAGTVNYEWHHIVAPSLFPTPCGRPDDFKATSPVDGIDNEWSYAECAITTQWNGAAGGINNPVIGYEIFANVWDWVNGRWDGWWCIAANLPASQRSWVVKPFLVRGQAIQLTVQAKSALGPGYSSEWSNIVTVRRNSLPTIPGDFAVKTDTSELSIFESEVTIRWNKSTDPDENFARYRLEYATSTNGSSWGAYQHLVSQAELSYTWKPNIAEGTFLKFRVRAEDALNAVSGWRESSAVRKEARSGLFVSVGGQVYPAKAYISVGGQVYPGKPFASAGGQVYPGKL